MSLQVLNQEQIVPASSAISEPPMLTIQTMQAIQTIQSTNAEEASSSACASSLELGNANTHEHLASLNFPIVVLGASAGGLAAFKEVFSSFKENPTPEMAFVVIQHLAPDVDSMLCELIQQDTLMPVLTIEEGMLIQVNHVYVITPDCALSCVDGIFHYSLPQSCVVRGVC
jgi:chemotaxis response regulator CheB